MIALILARGGSKGVPRKNIKDLNGKPLLSYPIEVAKNSKLISDVFVSTDDEEIASVAILYGAKVIYRPTELAGDGSLDIDSFKHFCLSINHYEPIVHLRATTPVTNYNIIDDAINCFDLNKYTSLRSAHEFPESIFKFYLKGEEYWKPIDKELAEKPRQEVPKTYVPNGYVDIVNPKVFMNGNDFYGDKIYPFITKFTSEIDTIDDFNYIEYLIKKNE
jgi:CMP-N-acetylneuraminic acid synthetase